MPSTSASPVRSMCGICTEAVSVTRPVAASKAACAPRVSSGSADWRRERIAISTISAAPANASATPVSMRPSTRTLPAACGCTSGAFGASAVSMSTTASSGSSSTATCSARSSASAAEAATTAATGSPT
jgi:hypothetical protein